MTPGQTRKLATTAGVVAAFFGFVALTAWTSSGEMDEQERRDLGTFCYVLSMSTEYESALQMATLGGSDVLGDGSLAESGLSSYIENSLLDFAPERYREDAEHLAEGLDRGLRGDLAPEEADEYVVDFRRLEQRASGDCEQFEGEVPQFGGGSPFGFDD
jgi:hypothetical protein